MTQNAHGLPPTKWTCDVCEEKIESVEDGYLIWKSINSIYSDFKIVHQNKCDTGNSYNNSLALNDLMGDDGLVKLLSFISNGIMAKNAGYDNKVHIENFYEYTDLVKRLHIPNYEEKRSSFFDDEYVRKSMEDGTDEVYPYLQTNLRK